MENKMTLHEKLNLIQTKLEAPKDMWAYNHKYKYRSAESILSALKPFLREFEVTLTTEMEIIIILHRVYVKCTVVLSDGKETISANGMAREEEVSNQGLNVAQITGSVTSYAKKYALGNLFAIDDVKDPDSNEPTQQVQAAQQSTTATVSQAKPKQAPKQAPKQVKQQAPQVDEERLMLLLQDISHARSRKTLTTIWNENKDLKSNPRFKEAVQEACKKYPK